MLEKIALILAAKLIEALVPEIKKAVEEAVAGAATRVAEVEDKLTDRIPGPVDDAVLDPITRRIASILRALGH